MNKLGLDFDFAQEEIILIEKATKRKEEEFLKRLNALKAYRQHKSILQDYFFRMSVIDKAKLIKRLVGNLSTAHSVLEIASCLSVGDAKSFIYLASDPVTSFKHDKFVTDHNRMLEEEDLETAINNDIRWFKSLEPDQQVDVVISLIKQTGGTVQHNVFLPIYKKYFCIRRMTEEEYVSRGISMPRLSIKKSKLAGLDESQDPRYSPNDPTTIEVENHRKNWNNIMAKYREKVTNMRESLRQCEGVVMKKPASKSAAELSKKLEKGKEAEDPELVAVIDWVQLMPVWIVKKIFNYLDQKTLQKIKNVNAYWLYITQDIIKERKMRIQLDKEIKKLEAQIDPAVLADIDKTKTRLNGRFVHYHERAAINKKLVPKVTGRMVHQSLMSEVMNTITEEFFPENIISFAKEQGNDKDVYRYEPCFLKDVNVTLSDKEDVKLQKSFVTYSAPSKTSTLNLSLDSETLEDW